MGNSCIPNNAGPNDPKEERLSLSPQSNRYSLDEGNAGLGQPFEIKQILNEHGGIYEGEVDKNQKRHGFGKQTYANGAQYEGYWVHNSQTGSGNLVYANGDVYHGELKDGKRHGYGTFTKANGDQ